jgi:hypothetical protein
MRCRCSYYHTTTATNVAAATSTTTTPGPQKNVGTHFNRHLTNLKQVPVNTNAEAYLNELKGRRSAKSHLHLLWTIQNGKLKLVVAI